MSTTFDLFLMAQTIDAITWAAVLLPVGILALIGWLSLERFRQGTDRMEDIIGDGSLLGREMDQ